MRPEGRVYDDAILGVLKVWCTDGREKLEMRMELMPGL